MIRELCHPPRTIAVISLRSCSAGGTPAAPSIERTNATLLRQRKIREIVDERIVTLGQNGADDLAVGGSTHDKNTLTEISLLVPPERARTVRGTFEETRQADLGILKIIDDLGIGCIVALPVRAEPREIELASSLGCPALDPRLALLSLAERTWMTAGNRLVTPSKPAPR